MTGGFCMHRQKGTKNAPQVIIDKIVKRNQEGTAPNRKWAMDIFYIHTSQGVLCLSIICDLYDNSIVAYKTGTQQSGIRYDPCLPYERRRPLQSCTSTINTPHKQILP
jgi:transposase InsO family protein